MVFQKRGMASSIRDRVSIYDNDHFSKTSPIADNSGVLLLTKSPLMCRRTGRTGRKQSSCSEQVSGHVTSSALAHNPSLSPGLLRESGLIPDIRLLDEEERETVVRESCSFLDDRSCVTGAADVIKRMSASPSMGANIEQYEGRSLLNKFIGSQLLLTGVESMMNQRAKPTVSVDIGGTSGASKTSPSPHYTMANTQLHHSSVSPAHTTSAGSGGRRDVSVQDSVDQRQSCQGHAAVIVDGVNINSVNDRQRLKALLKVCDDFDTRRKIRARMMELLENLSVSDRASNGGDDSVKQHELNSQQQYQQKRDGASVSVAGECVSCVSCCSSTPVLASVTVSTGTANTATAGPAVCQDSGTESGDEPYAHAHLLTTAVSAALLAGSGVGIDDDGTVITNDAGQHSHPPGAVDNSNGDASPQLTIEPTIQETLMLLHKLKICLLLNQQQNSNSILYPSTTDQSVTCANWTSQCGTSAETVCHDRLLVQIEDLCVSLTQASTRYKAHLEQRSMTNGSGASQTGETQTSVNIPSGSNYQGSDDVKAGVPHECRVIAVEQSQSCSASTAVHPNDEGQLHAPQMHCYKLTDKSQQQNEPQEPYHYNCVNDGQDLQNLRVIQQKNEDNEEDGKMCHQNQHSQQHQQESALLIDLSDDQIDSCSSTEPGQLSSIQSQQHLTGQERGFVATCVVRERSCRARQRHKHRSKTIGGADADFGPIRAAIDNYRVGANVGVASNMSRQFGSADNLSDYKSARNATWLPAENGDKETMFPAVSLCARSDLSSASVDESSSVGGSNHVGVCAVSEADNMSPMKIVSTLGLLESNVLTKAATEAHDSTYKYDANESSETCLPCGNIPSSFASQSEIVKNTANSADKENRNSRMSEHATPDNPVGMGPRAVLFSLGDSMDTQDLAGSSERSISSASSYSSCSNMLNSSGKTHCQKRTIDVASSAPISYAQPPGTQENSKISQLASTNLSGSIGSASFSEHTAANKSNLQAEYCDDSSRQSLVVRDFGGDPDQNISSDDVNNVSFNNNAVDLPGKSGEVDIPNSPEQFYSPRPVNKVSIPFAKVDSFQTSPLSAFRKVSPPCANKKYLLKSLSVGTGLGVSQFISSSTKPVANLNTEIRQNSFEGACKSHDIATDTRKETHSPAVFRHAGGPFRVTQSNDALMMLAKSTQNAVVKMKQQTTERESDTVTEDCRKYQPPPLPRTQFSHNNDGVVTAIAPTVSSLPPQCPRGYSCAPIGKGSESVVKTAVPWSHHAQHITERSSRSIQRSLSSGVLPSVPVKATPFNCSPAFPQPASNQQHKTSVQHAHHLDQTARHFNAALDDAIESSSPVSENIRHSSISAGSPQSHTTLQTTSSECDPLVNEGINLTQGSDASLKQNIRHVQAEATSAHSANENELICHSECANAPLHSAVRFCSQSHLSKSASVGEIHRNQYRPHIMSNSATSQSDVPPQHSSTESASNSIITNNINSSTGAQALHSGILARRSSCADPSSVHPSASKMSSQRNGSTNKGGACVSPFDKFRQLDTACKKPISRNSSSSSDVGSFRIDGGLASKAQSAKDMILYWCQCRLRAYKEVNVENFSTSWNDGMAFCALIHHFYPDAFDFDQLNANNRKENFQLAFSMADKLAGIYPLLDVEDMVRMRKPDWKSVFTYVQAIYSRLKDGP